jgi:hypothetical protein
MKYQISVNGYGYEVEIIDATHLKFTFRERMSPYALHFNQVSDEMMTALKEKGAVIDNRWFKTT